MLKKIKQKIINKLVIYNSDLKSKGLYWSIVHRIYKIPKMRKILTPITNYLKPDYLIIEGHKLFIDKKDSTISQELVQSGKWEDYETELFKKNIKSGGVVVDIGAHIGYYTLIAAKLVGVKGRVYAFEPDLKNFKLLQKNVKFNKYSNVILINKAVSNKSEDSLLFLNKENTGDHRIFYSGNERRSVKIICTTLDDYFKDKNTKIDIIKMDIQGAEVRALLGANNILSKNKHLILFTEFWPKVLREYGSTALEFINILKNYNFQIYEIDEIKKQTKAISRNQIDHTNNKMQNLICIKNT